MFYSQQYSIHWFTDFSTVIRDSKHSSKKDVLPVSPYSYTLAKWVYFLEQLGFQPQSFLDTPLYHLSHCHSTVVSFLFTWLNVTLWHVNRLIIDIAKNVPTLLTIRNTLGMSWILISNEFSPQMMDFGPVGSGYGQSMSLFELML